MKFRFKNIKLMAKEHFEGPMKILCGREGQYIGDHDADGDTSTMRTRIFRPRSLMYMERFVNKITRLCSCNSLEHTKSYMIRCKLIFIV